MGKPDIFLDMDGVLADLPLHMYLAWDDYSLRYRYSGLYPYQHRVTEPCASFETWMQDPMRWEYGPATNMTFWYGIPQFSWAKQLLSALKHIGRVRICSNPGRQAFADVAAMGKIRWCYQRLGVVSNHVTLLQDKFLLAQPGRVLIDDNDHNISEWRKAGGTGILFPQPWNSAAPLVDDDPVAYVMNELEKLSPPKEPHHA